MAGGGLTMQRRGGNSSGFDGVWPKPSNLDTDEDRDDAKKAKALNYFEGLNLEAELRYFKGSIVGTALHKQIFPDYVWATRDGWEAQASSVNNTLS